MSPTTPTLRPFGLAGLMLALVWWLASSGLVSSNDGSHLALARALVLRHSTTIDPEVALTLWVDRAERAGHAYSDRPPGTAFAVLPAVWLGDRLDAPLLERSLATREILVTPAAGNFAQTYIARSQRLRVRATPLLALQGTALLLGLHAILMGLLGLFAMDAIARRRGASVSARTFAILGLGLATLWGPYSTALFSHVTTGTMLVLFVDALDRAKACSRARVAAVWACVSGLSGAWAVASDYLAVLAVIPLFAVILPWRARPRLALWVALGALPVALVTAAYHDAAFGSPWSIGYDHHANFDFARVRGSTFDGDPLAGLWTLWGLGRGAGVLALAPVTLVGVVGLWRSSERRWLLAVLPWIVALSLHHTPWGGASEDHRYLVPLLPILGLGLARAWSHAAAHPRARILVPAIVALAAVSAALAWTHVLSTRG